MTNIIRYALYLVPSGDLAGFGAGWLGWDIALGHAVPHRAVADLPRPLADLTAAARPYGFHATVKPPFRLAPESTPDQLIAATAALAADEQAFDCDGFELSNMDGFLALTPRGETTNLNALAARIVASLDRFRAPPLPGETERRRAAGLTPQQEAHLLRWGYPYVLDQFRAHFTLTGRLADADMVAVAAVLEPVLAPILGQPYRVDNICLAGEQASGGFRLLHRFALEG